MASRKVSINLFGPKSTFVSSNAISGPSKIIVGQTTPQLITENAGDASTRENKLVSCWKKSTEVNHSKYAWFLKDIEDETLQLYLYASKNFDVETNDIVGKLLDLYIIPNTESVYMLSK